MPQRCHPRRAPARESDYHWRQRRIRAHMAAQSHRVRRTHGRHAYLRDLAAEGGVFSRARERAYHVAHPDDAQGRGPLARAGCVRRGLQASDRDGFGGAPLQLPFGSHHWPRPLPVQPRRGNVRLRRHRPAVGLRGQGAHLRLPFAGAGDGTRVGTEVRRSGGAHDLCRLQGRRRARAHTMQGRAAPQAGF